MSESRLPDVPAWGSGITESERVGAISHLRDLAAAGDMALDRFSELADAIVQVTSRDEFVALLRGAPLSALYTPPERRMTEPLVLRSNTGGVKMTGRWQVASRTEVHVGTGGVHLDLSGAEFDGPVVDLDIHVGTGGVTVIVPPAVTLQLVEVTGNVRNQLGDRTPLPGGPIVRLRASTGTGGIRLRAPQTRRPKHRWWNRSKHPGDRT